METECRGATGRIGAVTLGLQVLATFGASLLEVVSVFVGEEVGGLAPEHHQQGERGMSTADYLGDDGEMATLIDVSTAVSIKAKASPGTIPFISSAHS